MEHSDTGREPCPYRIVEDLGGAFCMGSCSGFLWHFGKGFYNSPTRERLSGGFYNARYKAPSLGGNFAVWGGMFSGYDCFFQYLRGKDDYWNAIASGAATGGTLSLRGGLKTAAKQASVGALLLAIIEGVMVIFSRKSTVTPRDQYYQMMEIEKEAKRKKVNKPESLSKAKNYIRQLFDNSNESNKESVSEENKSLNDNHAYTSGNQYQGKESSISSFSQYVTSDMKNQHSNEKKWFSS